MNVSDVRAPQPKTPKPRAQSAPAGPTAQASTRDGLSLSAARPAGGSPPAGSADFRLGDAAERLIAQAGGDLEQAYFRSINMRNADPKAPSYQRDLVQLSLDAGLSRPITKDELRDVEHYLFAAAYTAGIAPSKPDDGYLEKVGKTLARELTFASAVASTVGYSAAKVANEASKALFDKPLLKSRTKPSIEELLAGIQGAARGLTD